MFRNRNGYPNGSNNSRGLRHLLRRTASAEGQRWQECCYPPAANGDAAMCHASPPRGDPLIVESEGAATCAATIPTGAGDCASASSDGVGGNSERAGALVPANGDSAVRRAPSP
eukprot:2503508-Prymnesium_polylepis.1